MDQAWIIRDSWIVSGTGAKLARIDETGDTLFLFDKRSKSEVGVKLEHLTESTKPVDKT